MVWQGKKGWETEGLFLREEGQQLRQTISKCLSSLKVSWRHKTFPDTYALVGQVPPRGPVVGAHKVQVFGWWPLPFSKVLHGGGLHRV
jgi:hypothetical protein